MFRVLTERKGKETGYFVDLLSDRFVSFMYQYDNYTNKGKKNLDIKTKRKLFIEKLFNFDLNGISSFSESKSMIPFYNTLPKNLNIDTIENFASILETTDEKNIKDVLDTLELRKINDLYSQLKDLDLDFSNKPQKPSKKPKLKLTKPKDNNHNLNIDFELNKTGGENNSDNKTDKPDSDKDNDKKKNEIVAYIKDVFSLFILFENEPTGNIQPNCNRDSIEKFIKFIGGYTIRKDEVRTLCEESNNKYLIDCHIGYLKK